MISLKKLKAALSVIGSHKLSVKEARVFTIIAGAKKTTYKQLVAQAGFKDEESAKLRVNQLEKKGLVETENNNKKTKVLLSLKGKNS